MHQVRRYVRVLQCKRVSGLREQRKFYISTNGTCETCTMFGDTCESCNASVCLYCGDESSTCEDLRGCKVFNGTTCSECDIGYYPNNGECETCTRFGDTCESCNASVCLDCGNSESFYISTNGTCETCTIFGDTCESCNASVCLDCGDESFSFRPMAHARSTAVAKCSTEPRVR